MDRLRGWLDMTPLASIALALAREATGREEPVVPLVPVRPARLERQCRVGFWALSAGMGTSTLAALVAQRASAGGPAPILIDLDRWAPSLALRAAVEGATLGDALVQPGREAELVSRWGEVPFLPGSPELHRVFDADRVRAVIERVAGGRAIVLDLGAGADALDPLIVTALTRLVLVSGTRAAQLQATFAARALLRGVSCPVALVVVDAAPEDARRVAQRAGLTLIGAIPHDPYLARDEFAARADTLRAIDAVVRSL